MNEVTNKTIHTDFRLNDNQFDSTNGLLNYSKTLSFKLFSFLKNWLDESDYMVMQTSGSTGKPKSIKVRKDHMVNSATATGIYFDLKPKTTALLCLPLEYIAGKMMLIRSIILGWHVDIVEPTSTPMDQIVKSYDFTAMVPLQLYNSFEKLDKIKKIIVGGGKINDDIRTRIMDLPTKIFATYGMTETVTHIAVRSLNKASGYDIDNNHYQSLPNVILSKDHRDCLIIHAPDVTKKSIITNDIVDLISNTRFRWLGRYDHIINSGGIKLIPEQIEKKIQPIMNHRFFVSSIDDDIFGDKVILIIEGDHTISNQKILKNQISKLGSILNYEKPKEVYYIKNFIMTATNKIDRNKTKEMILN